MLKHQYVSVIDRIGEATTLHKDRFKSNSNSTATADTSTEEGIFLYYQMLREPPSTLNRQSASAGQNPSQTLLENSWHPLFILKKLNSEEVKWQNYLDNLPQISQGKFDKEYVALMKKVRNQLHNFLKDTMLPPDVVEGEDGGLQLIWEKDHHILTVDLISNENTEWFFKDRSTGNFWGAEEVALSDFPPKELQEKLIVWK